MAIICKTGRPALRFDPTGDLEPQKLWRKGSARLLRVTDAARAVARIEIEGGVFPWAGTAFVVAPRLALTASYVGDAIATSPVVWLNFANNPADEPSRRIKVAAIERVHPRWRFCYLCLDEDAPAAPLALASQDRYGDVNGCEIVAIGYSSFDQRNEHDVQNAIFDNVFDVKRVSPGKTLGLEHIASTEPSILHDASTLGGSGGAPLIDTATGEVLGLHYSGLYLSKNQAMGAWNARGDPQWERLWTSKRAAETIMPNEAKPPTQTPEIFDYKQLKAIKAWLGQARINDDSSLKMLFMGLSPEFMGQVPAAELIMDRIELALDYLNDRRKIWGGYTPLYYVLTNARERRQFEPDALAQIDTWLTKVSNKL